MGKALQPFRTQRMGKDTELAACRQASIGCPIRSLLLSRSRNPLYGTINLLFLLRVTWGGGGAGAGRPPLAYLLID